MDGRPLVDVIIVMGAAVWQNRQPSPVLKRRLLHAVALIKEGRARHLLATGGLGHYPPTEASLVKSLAIQEGVPPENIFMEERGRTTFEILAGCCRVMREHHWSKPLVVSDAYHLPRALFVLRGFGFQASGSPATKRTQTRRQWRWRLYCLRECIAFPWYAWRILVWKVSRRADLLRDAVTRSGRFTTGS